MVDRCICKRLTFKYLLEASKSMMQHGPTGERLVPLHALADKTGCGMGCGMCVPYLLVAIKLNKPRVPIMTVEDFEKHLGSPVPRCLADVPMLPGEASPLSAAG
jgi:hypothetical protein